MGTVNLLGPYSAPATYLSDGSRPGSARCGNGATSLPIPGIVQTWKVALNASPSGSTGNIRRRLASAPVLSETDRFRLERLLHRCITLLTAMPLNPDQQALVESYKVKKST
jgi:hypothetical protein